MSLASCPSGGGARRAGATSPEPRSSAHAARSVRFGLHFARLVLALLMCWPVASRAQQPPQPLDDVVAGYPSAADGLSGDVRVRVTVDAAGDLVDAAVLDGPEVFHDAALAAVRAVTFAPAVTDGVAVAGTVDLTVSFVPPDDDDDVFVVEGHHMSEQDTHARETLGEAELARSAGEDLATAASRVPGVVAMKGTADTSKPIIRGMQERRLLLLFDGVRHEGQKWGLDHAPEIDPFAAGEVSVIKGAAGVRWGPDAIGGVVLVEPPPLRGTPGVNGKVQVVGVSNGARGVAAGRLDVAPGAVPGLSWRIDGNVGRGAAVSAPDYVLGNTGSTTWNAGATLQWQRGSDRFMASFRHYDLRAGVCFCVHDSTPADLLAQLDADAPIGAERWKTTYRVDRPYQAVRHELALLRGVHAVGGRGVISATYAFQHDHRREYEPVRGDVDGAQFDFTLRTHTLDAAFVHSPVGLRGSWVAEGAVGASGTFQENVYAGLPLIPNHRSLSGGVFAWERFAAPEAAVEVGARYDHAARTSFLSESAWQRGLSRGTLDPDACEQTETAARCPRRFDTGSVSVGGVWHAVRDRVDVRLDLSSASRFPSSDELYLNGSAPTFPVYALGDPGLGAETAWSASPTVGIALPWLEAEVSAFATYIDSFVAFGPELRPDGTPHIDVTIHGAYARYAFTAIDAVSFGADGGVTLGPDAPVGARVAGALVRTRDTATGAGVPLTPADRLDAAVTFRPRIRALHEPFVEIGAHAVARQRDVDPTADLAPPPPGFVLLDAAAGTRIDVGRQEVDVGVELSNVLDTAYREYTSLLRYYADQPGRELRVRLGLSF